MSTWRKLVFALFCAALLLSPALAEARAGGTARFGGGMSYSSHGSMGSRTYNYNGGQPIERSITPQTRGNSPYYGGPAGFAQRHPFMTGLGGAFLGSWLGSLLFPHWGMGYGGYGFGGVLGSVFSWLLIIFVVSMVFRLFRRGRLFTTANFNGTSGGGSPPGYAGSSYGGAGTAMGREFTVTQADYGAFEAILKSVQGAWGAGDLGTLRHYVTPEMLSYFSESLAANNSQGVENHVERVELIRGDVREAWDEGALQYATCLLHWRALDYTARTDRKRGEPGWLAEGDADRPSEAQELWTFARSRGGHWLLSAVQQL